MRQLPEDSKRWEEPPAKGDKNASEWFRKKPCGGLVYRVSSQRKELIRLLAGISLFPLAFIPYVWDNWFAQSTDFYLFTLPPTVPWVIFSAYGLGMILSGDFQYKGHTIFPWVAYFVVAIGIAIPVLAWFLRSPSRSKKD